MERIKRIIFKKLISKDASVEYDAVETGINEYILLNGLDVVAENLSDSMLEKYINAFLMPLDSFNGEMMVEYFKDFSTLSEFKILSNYIFEQAKSKLHGNKFDKESINEKFEEISRLYTELYKNKTMQQVLDKHLSECKLDMKFICVNSENLSIRLQEEKTLSMVRTIDKSNIYKE